MIPTTNKAPTIADDLDEILALEPKQDIKKPVKASLPKPGSIAKKPVVTADKKQDKDDEAWLDDLLG